jgi:hypothetical protein
LRYFLLLSHWPEILGPALDPKEIFYARYFWFCRFAERFQTDNGPDAGIEQQSLKLLEEAPDSVDWDRVQQLDARARQV